MPTPEEVKKAKEAKKKAEKRENKALRAIGNLVTNHHASGIPSKGSTIMPIFPEDVVDAKRKKYGRAPLMEEHLLGVPRTVFAFCARNELAPVIKLHDGRPTLFICIDPANVRQRAVITPKQKKKLP